MMRLHIPARPERRASRRAHLLAALFVSALGCVLLLTVAAPAQDLRRQVEEKRAKLQQKKQQRGVLSTQISRLNNRIEKLTGQVAALRNREARVAAELAEAEAQLERERENLRILRKRLRRTTEMLASRLVAIYKSEEPDAITVVLDSNGFEDIVEQSEYLSRIQSQDAGIVSRVRELRDDTKATVERIRATRDAIAAKQRELERTRVALEARERELGQARARSASTLKRVRGNIQRLHGHIDGLEDQIREQLAAAAAESSPEAPAQLPAGPVRSGSGGMVWPVNGPVTSPFGMRWGRLHAGIDIAVPAGTPIRAVKDGVIALAAPTGGYGNYTCINHGGGLSSCYAHLSSYAKTSGSVGQGEVIGAVGCTGHCFGDHLHFEIRVNGSPVDPMGYL